MYRNLLIVFLLFFPALITNAQEADTVANQPADTFAPYNELMRSLGSSVFSSDSLNVAMLKQIEKNGSRKTTCYRLRIYFDNSQNARTVSEQVSNKFSFLFPDVPVYRVYVNPYFKVTVGNFRNKSDAMRFLNELKPHFPSVFLIKESFSTI